MRFFKFKSPVFLLLFSLLAVLLSSCGSSKSVRLRKQVNKVFQEVSWDQHFTGLMVVDLNTGDTLYRKNERRYFTPASNIKILTLYAALRNLPEQIPSLQYLKQGDITYFRGMADPSQLHPYFQDSTAIKFLQQQDSLVYVEDTFDDQPFGPGWAWEDFDAGYAPERSPLPLYGNVLSVYPGRAPIVRPGIFSTKVDQRDHEFRRSPEANHFFIGPRLQDTLEVPYRTSAELTLSLFEDILDKDVGLAARMPEGDCETLFGINKDSLLRRMMVESDNFLAEQLLLAVALQREGKMDSKAGIKGILNSDLEFMPDEPRWVDGSGLSRYNLVTPASILSILRQLQQEYSLLQLQTWFPAGGESGTLEDWYAGDPAPYVYAKSGTLGNNYNLSGYLVSKRGRLLAFSLMHNHFLDSQYEIRSETERLLKALRDTY